jgi:hypothetical protein
MKQTTVAKYNDLIILLLFFFMGQFYHCCAFPCADGEFSKHFKLLHFPSVGGDRMDCLLVGNSHHMSQTFL